MKFGIFCIAALLATAASYRHVVSVTSAANRKTNLATTASGRIDMADGVIKELSKVDSEEAGAATCSAETCAFDAASSCDCSSMVDDPGLLERAKRILTETLQRMRKVSDKLTEESGIFDKWWWSSSLDQAKTDLDFLEKAMEHELPGLQSIMNVPVKKIPVSDFTVPEVAHPINVEVWDHNDLTRQVFIGETGVDFEEGGTLHELHLQKNTHQTGAWVDPQGATVKFFTDLTISPEPFECSVLGATRCKKMNLVVKCLSAKDLPNTDTGLFGNVTDPYCKVRVKKDLFNPSVKFKTPPIHNNLNPDFPHDEEGSYLNLIWDVPVTEPVPTNEDPDETQTLPEDQLVPWTSDHATLNEQLENQVLYLAATVFLDKDGKCKEGDKNTQGCGMIEALESDVVQASKFPEVHTSSNASAMVELHKAHADAKGYYYVRPAYYGGYHRSYGRRHGYSHGWGSFHIGPSFRLGGRGCGGCWMFLFLFLLF